MIDTNKLIDDYLGEAWWVKDNSNIDFSNMALNNKISEAVIKHYWLTQVYTEDIRKAYERGLFHIHNLGHYTTYCVGWDIEDILLRGFKGQPGRQSSSPAKHFDTALGHIYNFMYTLQGESAGAQALSNFDTYLAPFIREDGLTQREVDQNIQKFLFNMNVPTRVGGQQPFTNVTLDQQIPKFMENDQIIIGGKYTVDTYGSYQDEMDMLNKAWWKQRIEGDADGRPQPFPIETLNVTKDFNWNDELLMEAITKRGSPYFSNFINSDMSPEDVRSMCCRIRVNNAELIKRGGGFFGSNPLTGSIGVVTMNLPLMGYLASDEDRFFELLDFSLTIGKESLEMKRKLLEKRTVSKLYPYSMVYLEKIFERFGEYWKNHFSTLGLLGMNEGIRNLLGVNIVDKEGLKFSKKVLHFFRAKALEFQKETGNMYNVEGTPAETTAYTLALNDLRKHPNIIHAGTRDRPYYTNSTQVPNNVEMGLTQQLKHQDQLQPLYTGGTVFHIWNGEAIPDPEGTSKLLKRILSNVKMYYISYNPTTSICPSCGFMYGEHFTCPDCGRTCEVWTRITGYFSPLRQWNPGKRQEYEERPHFIF